MIGPGSDPGYGGAEDRTRERAAERLPSSKPPSRWAADDLAQAFAVPGTSLTDVGEPLPYVRVADLLESGYAGKRAVPLLVIADEMESRLAEGQVDLPVFADALTALLVACNREPPEEVAIGLPHVANAVSQYLTARREPGFGELDRDLLSQHQAGIDFEELADRIPWLLWWAPGTEDRPHPVPVGPDELVDLLVLIRPRRERRGGSDRPLERFARLYRCQVGLDSAALAELAEALGWVLDAPHKAASRLQTLRLPDSVRAAADRRVRREIDASTDLANMFAVLVEDGYPAKAVFVNLSRRQLLRLQLPGDRLLELSPNAVEDKGVTAYCSAPVPIDPGTRLTWRGHTAVRFDEPVRAMADHVDYLGSMLPADIFRGRTRELGRLRSPIHMRGYRTGSLISGPRRAGKSTLMEQVGLERGLRWPISLDVANCVDRVSSFAEWNRAVTRKLVAEIEKKLPGFTPSTEDLVETLIDLDVALGDGPPVAVALDELDVLLAPEQGSDGPRMAGRLGSQRFSNLVVMGTVQRFHRSEHEFKSWQKIECSPDLTWADGVTYFFEPLYQPPQEGPHVKWLTRAGVTPQHFADLIFPAIGLRPYFWAQLRLRLESAVRDETGSRLADENLIRATLAELTNDQHLTLVTDRGEQYDAAERRRKDLFSDDERRILLAFATTPQPGSVMSKEKAESIGGAAAVKELIDRAWLTHDRNNGRVWVAVRIYEDYLRSVASDLRDLVDAAPAHPAPAVTRPISASGADERRPAPKTVEERSPSVRSASAPRTTNGTASVSGSASPPTGTQARAKPAKPVKAASGASPTSAKETKRPVAPAKPASATPPSTGPKRPGTTTNTATGSAANSKNPTRSAPPAKAAAGRATPSAGQVKPSAGPNPSASPVDYSPPSDAELNKIHTVLRRRLAVDGVLKFAAVGSLISGAVPRIGNKNDWCGTGRLTEFFEAYLTEYDVRMGEHDREVRAAKVRKAPVLARLVEVLRGSER